MELVTSIAMEAIARIFRLKFVYHFLLDWKDTLKSRKNKAMEKRAPHDKLDVALGKWSFTEAYSGYLQ